MSITVTTILILIAFLGGIGTTTIGPGGIFVTIAVFLLLNISPGAVAGTMSVAFIGTGLVGTIAYFRSGQLRDRATQRLAATLSLTSVAGGIAGAWLNQWVGHDLFGTLLGAFVTLTGLLILVRERSATRAATRPPSTIEPDGDLQTPPAPSTDRLDASNPIAGTLTMATLGVFVGTIGGLLGVGGPVLAVPLLILLDIPMLTAVALAQVQSLFIASFATVGFALQRVIDWRLALLIGLPLVLGTLAGWAIAQRANTQHLKLVMGVVLIGLGVYLSV